MADRDSGKFLKKLVGRTEVEDALSRLDMLTKEESLLAVVGNLKVAHYVNGVVHDIGANVKAIEGVARNVDNGTQHFLSSCIYRPPSLLYFNVVAHELKCLSLTVTSIVDRQG